MYSPETLIATLAAVAGVSAAILTAVYVILPRIMRRAHASRKGH